MATTVVSTMIPLPDQQPKVNFSTPSLPLSSYTPVRRSSHSISAMLNPEPEISSQRRSSVHDISPELDSSQDSSPDSPSETTSTPNVEQSSTSPQTSTTMEVDTIPPSNPPKAKRKRITPEQLKDLVALFEQTDTPSFEIREQLAKKLGMTNREIQVWFQNRRAKANRAKANEHNVAYNHRFMHLLPGSVAQAAGAGGAAPHYGPNGASNNNSQIQFIPVFGSNVSQPIGFSSKRADRRRSSCHGNNSLGFQPLISSNPQAHPSTAAPSKFVVPPPIKITPYNQPGPRSAPALSFQSSSGASTSSMSPPGATRPISPISPGSPPHPTSNYAPPSSHHPSYQPYRSHGTSSVYSPTTDLFNMSLNSKYSPPSSPPYNSSNQLPAITPGHSNNQHPLPPLSSQPFFNSTAPHRPSEPKSAIDLLATAAEFVQTQERKENETRRRASVVSYSAHPYQLPQPSSSIPTTLPSITASVSMRRPHEAVEAEKMHRRRSLSDAWARNRDREKMGVKEDRGGEWRPWV